MIPEIHFQVGGIISSIIAGKNLQNIDQSIYCIDLCSVTKLIFINPNSLGLLEVQGLIQPAPRIDVKDHFLILKKFIVNQKT